MLVLWFAHPHHLRVCCRYVLGYKVNSGQQSCRAKGPRSAGGRVVHLVSASATVHQLQSLITDKLMPHYSSEEFEVQVCMTLSLFHGSVACWPEDLYSTQLFRKIVLFSAVLAL